MTNEQEKEKRLEQIRSGAKRLSPRVPWSVDNVRFLLALVDELKAEVAALKKVLESVGAEEHRAKKLAQKYLDNLGDAGATARALLEERDAALAQVDALKAALAERDAQCAAMREALEVAKEHCCDLDQEIWDTALATDAGKATLERLEKAEGENVATCTDCGGGMVWAHRGLGRLVCPTCVLVRAEKLERELELGNEMLAASIRDIPRHTALVQRETKERCAKVAEEYPAMPSVPLEKQRIAAAIRALPEDGT